METTSTSGPRCIVIGASGTLGRAVVTELAHRGATVAGTFHTGEAALAELGRSVPGLVTSRLDLAKPEDIEPAMVKLAERLGGRVDALVTCATVISARSIDTEAARFDRLHDIEPDLLAKLLAVNVAGPLLCLRALAGAQNGTPRTRGEGKAATHPVNVVLVGSIDGVKPMPMAVPYATSKGALVAMVRSLAKELGPSNFLVNVVAPGLLDAGASRLVPDERKREYLKHSAAKRFGRPDEIARSIAWLALSNTYVTGQTLVLDGGV